MSELNGPDPETATNPRYSSLNRNYYSGSVSQELKNEAEQLYAYVTYSTSSPYKQKKSFEYLSIIMMLAQSDILTEEELNKAYKEVIEIKEALYGGEICFANRHFEDLLHQILQRMTDDNPRAKLLMLNMELEYLLLLHVPENGHPIEEADCHKLLAPVKLLAFDPEMTSLHLLTLSKQLIEVKERLIERPDERHLHLSYLENLFK